MNAGREAGVFVSRSELLIMNGNHGGFRTNSPWYEKLMTSPEQ